MATLQELLVKAENAKKRVDDVDIHQHPLAIAVDKHLENEQEHQFRKAKGFYPSDAKTCARYWVYMFRGVPIESNHDARVLRIFDTGNSMHERFTEYFRKMGILIDEEVKVPDRDGYPKVRGYADNLIKFDEVYGLGNHGNLGNRVEVSKASLEIVKVLIKLKEELK